MEIKIELYGNLIFLELQGELFNVKTSKKKKQ